MKGELHVFLVKTTYGRFNRILAGKVKKMFLDRSSISNTKYIHSKRNAVYQTVIDYDYNDYEMYMAVRRKAEDYNYVYCVVATLSEIIEGIHQVDLYTEFDLPEQTDCPEEIFSALSKIGSIKELDSDAYERAMTWRERVKGKLDAIH